MARGQSGIVGLTLRGKVGNAVFQRCGDELMVRARVIPRDPQTPLQMETRARMTEVGGLWASLDDAEFAAWRTYAAREKVASAWAAYLGLTSKWLIVNAPSYDAPTMPPVGPFYGDNVTITISPSWSGSSPRGGRGESHEGASNGPVMPPPPAPSSKTNHLEEGVLRILGSQPNARGVVTEVLVQRLANARRLPKQKEWRTAAFVTFEEGALEAEIPLRPGAWAVGYRFVNPSTGQQTTMTEIGATTV